MKATFVEISGFTEAVSDFLPDDVYAVLQHFLMANPESGDVMPGCGGLRKVRVADSKRRKGKRGGARVIYLHVPAAHRFYMLDIYGKDEKVNISTEERKYLRELAVQLKQEATAAVEQSPKETK